MVTLTVKNKIQLKLDKLLIEAGKSGAVPGTFIMSSGEYTEFLMELEAMSEASRQSITVKPLKNENESERFILNRQINSTTLTADEISALVTKWIHEEYTTAYSGIPLIYASYKR